MKSHTAKILSFIAVFFFIFGAAFATHAAQPFKIGGCGAAYRHFR